MNERIKEKISEISQKARQHANEYVDDEVESQYELKFAELIIKECLKLNKFQLTSIPLNQEDWDEHNYGFAAAVFRTQSVVKQHFGVEE
jgi:hypothetical protein